MTTRAEFLARIRAEMARTRGLFPAAPAERPARPRERLELMQRELRERWPETLEHFRVEFERVGGVLHRVRSTADVPALVVRLCRERHARSVVAWPTPALGVDLTPLTGAGIAVEPMTAPADAFNSGTDLVTLAPAGELGDELSVSWGIQAL